MGEKELLEIIAEYVPEMIRHKSSASRNSVSPNQDDSETGKHHKEKLLKG